MTYTHFIENKRDRRHRRRQRVYEPSLILLDSWTFSKIRRPRLQAAAGPTCPSISIVSSGGGILGQLFGYASPPGRGGLVRLQTAPLKAAPCPKRALVQLHSTSALTIAGIKLLIAPVADWRECHSNWVGVAVWVKQSGELRYAESPATIARQTRITCDLPDTLDGSNFQVV